MKRTIRILTLTWILFAVTTAPPTFSAESEFSQEVRISLEELNETVDPVALSELLLAEEPQQEQQKALLSELLNG